MIEYIWFSVVGFACILAITNWRAGIYAGIALDALRDPVRKLSEEQPVSITLSGVVVWLFVIMIALTEKRGEIAKFLGRYPSLKTTLSCLLLALIPAAALSSMLYINGYQLAVIGCISYLAPLTGLAVGYMYPRSIREVHNLLKFYTIFNSLLLIGVPLEYLKYDVPALGGIEIDWIRYTGGGVVDLMAGFYRSPDIMGLHAAHVTMFSLILAMNSKPEGKLGWGTLTIWSLFCLLVSGRRKMIGVPLVFLAFFLFLGMIRKVRSMNRLFEIAAIIGVVGAASVVLVWSPDKSGGYTDYAVSIFTEGGARANDQMVHASITTLQQVGLLGGGLGTATQGRYYVNVQTSRNARGWQEDGVSRLMMEFGLPGFFLLIAAVYCLLKSLKSSVWIVDPQSAEQQLQIGMLSVVAGNAASYGISHQQYSGDPVSALIVTICAGIVMGLPGVYATNRSRMLQAQQAFARQPIATVKPQQGGVR